MEEYRSHRWILILVIAFAVCYFIAGTAVYFAAPDALIHETSHNTLEFTTVGMIFAPVVFLLALAEVSETD